MSALPIVDARGMRCPWPALRLARAMRGAAGVILLADDPAAPGEIAALADRHGWRIDRAPHETHRFRIVSTAIG